MSLDNNNKIKKVVIWRDYTGLERVCTIIGDNDSTYDLLLPERNVPVERLYYDQSNQGKQLKKGDKIWYYRSGKYQECLLEKIDWASDSAQIRPLKYGIDKSECISM